MRLKEISDGLVILSKYRPSAFLNTNHGVCIYIDFYTGNKVSKTDSDYLEQLGWRWVDDVDWVAWIAYLKDD